MSGSAHTAVARRLLFGRAGLVDQAAAMDVPVCGTVNVSAGGCMGCGRPQ